MFGGGSKAIGVGRYCGQIISARIEAVDYRSSERGSIVTKLSSQVIERLRHIRSGDRQGDPGDGGSRED